jgi:hypothetical protein
MEGTLENDFAGDWTGTASLATSLGRNALYASVAMRVAVSVQGATLGNLCPSFGQSEAKGLPSVTVTGAGAAAAWSGTVVCPEARLPGCDGAVVTYTDATLTRSRRNQLVVVASGTAKGCGRTEHLVLTFVGVK